MYRESLRAPKWCVIQSNLKHYHGSSIGDRKSDDNKEIQTAAGCGPAYKHKK